MNKQRFTDDSYSLAKALFNISSAKQFLELIAIDQKKETKMLFTGFIQKLNYILSNILDRLNSEDRESLKKELSDSISMDAILDDLVRMNNTQRALVESITNAIVKGEIIEFQKAGE